jgi:hypothetical protein
MDEREEEKGKLTLLCVRLSGVSSIFEFFELLNATQAFTAGVNLDM